MKKTILATMTVAAALVASAPLAKANSFLELISGGLSATTTYGANSGNFDTTVGSWTVGVIITGTGTGTPYLTANLQGVDNADFPTAGLTVIYSSGSYNVPSGTATFSESQSGDTLVAGATVWTGLALYTGSGSKGTLFMASLSLPAASNGSTAESGGLTGNPALFVTEQLDFGGGSGAALPGTFQNINATASFTVVPDGGLTMAMLGSSLLLLAGIRARLSKKS